jgi:hypothetical protein
MLKKYVLNPACKDARIPKQHVENRQNSIFKLLQIKRHVQGKSSMME